MLPGRFAVFGIRDRGGVIRWAALHRGRQLNCAAGEAKSLYDFVSPLQQIYYVADLPFLYLVLWEDETREFQSNANDCY